MNKVLAALIAVTLAVLLNTFIIMACWNYLAPILFGLKTITFFQALVLAVLVRSIKGGDLVRANQ